jgi:hypothetical protein
MANDLAVRPSPARDLSPEEQQEETDLCFGLHREITSALAQGRNALWEAAKALHEFDQHAGWKRLGYERKTEWLGDPDVSLTYSTYMRLLDCYRTVCLNRGVDFEEVRHLEMTKVQAVLPAIKNGEKFNGESVETKDALSDVKSLSRSDLIQEYGKPKDEEIKPDSEQKPEDVILAGDSEPVRASDLSDDGEVIEGTATESESLAAVLSRYTRAEIEQALSELGYEAKLEVVAADTGDGDPQEEPVLATSTTGEAQTDAPQAESNGTPA